MFGKATVILRGYTYQQVRLIASILAENGKVKNMEITLNTKDAFSIIQRIADEFGSILHIGAGTVLNYEDLAEAIDAGAKFVLAPNMMSQAMIDYCKAKNVIAIPGAFTPSEISECFRQGADIVKVFPANEVSYAYARKVCEPLGDLPLMAVGGVTTRNVKEVLSSGYKYVGTAGGIFKKEDLLALDRDGLTRSISEFENALG